jgi:hypothetical protein
MTWKVLTTPYGIRTFGRTFNQLDIYKTGGVASGALSAVIFANRKYILTNMSAGKHAKAIQSARISRMLLNCQRVLKL